MRKLLKNYLSVGTGQLCCLSFRVVRPFTTGLPSDVEKAKFREPDLSWNDSGSDSFSLNESLQDPARVDSRGQRAYGFVQ